MNITPPQTYFNLQSIIPASTEEAVNDQVFSENEDSKDSIQTLIDYPGDLQPDEKSYLKSQNLGVDIVCITFDGSPSLNFTIRTEDIFERGAEAIVNAANTSLEPDSGIDGAIHFRGGPQYAEAHEALKKKYNSQYVEGYAEIIDCGKLGEENWLTKKVIVVACPIGETSPEKESQLYSCYYNSLVLADKHNLKSIAFPSISTGKFGFSRVRGTHISIRAVYDFAKSHPNTSLVYIAIHLLTTNPKDELAYYRKAILP